MNSFIVHYRKWLLVLLLAAVGSVAALHADLRDNVLDLLPGEAVRNDIRILQDLGMVNKVFISLSLPADTAGSQLPDPVLLNSARQVGELLAASEAFRDVVYRLDQGYEFAIMNELSSYLPAMVTEEELNGIAANLNRESLEKILQDHFITLNSPAGLPMLRQIQRDPLEITALALKRLQFLRGEFSLAVDQGFFVSEDRKSCLLWAESRLPLTDSVHAEKINKLVTKALEQGVESPVRARVIGTLPHTLVNARTVKKDLQLLLPLASAGLLIFLLLTLRSLRALLVMTIPFLAAPPAIALVQIIYGQISAIALGFGIVLLGIAVDFAVHLYLALARENQPAATVLAKIKRPIALATLTTVSVFVVILFSAVPSHRQMATLALGGIILAVLFAWHLIPTIVPKNRDFQGDLALPGGPPAKNAPSGPLFSGPSIAGIVCWLLLLAGGIWAWPQLTYNGDLRSLDVPSPEILADEEIFRATWRQNQDPVFIVIEGRDMDEILRQNDHVFSVLRQAGIPEIQSVAPLIPAAAVQEANIARWQLFWNQHRNTLQQDLATIGGDIGFTTDAFTPLFQWLATPPKRIAAEKLLHSPLRPVLISLLRLPEDSTTRNGSILLTTIIKECDSSLEQQITGGYPAIFLISTSKWRRQVENLLRYDIIRLSSAAGLLICILTTLYFRRLPDIIAALAPVLAALAAMALFSYWTTGFLNMMHVLMGIMVIGLSVDYGIFTVYGHRDNTRRTTARAVSICAMSTLIGFGALSLSHHYALSTLGSTVLAGISAAWPTAIFISPFFVQLGTLPPPGSAK